MPPQDQFEQLLNQIQLQEVFGDKTSVALELPRSTEYGQPLEHAIPLHMPSYADLFSLIDIENIHLKDFQYETPEGTAKAPSFEGTPVPFSEFEKQREIEREEYDKYKADSREVRQNLKKGITERLRRGDSPGGVVGYYYPKTTATLGRKDSKRGEVGGQYIATKTPETAPDTIKAYLNIMQPNLRRLMETLMHEGFHASPKPGESGFLHDKYPQYTFRRDLLVPSIGNIYDILPRDKIDDIISSLSQGKSVDIDKIIEDLLSEAIESEKKGEGSLWREKIELGLDRAKVD